MKQLVKNVIIQYKKIDSLYDLNAEDPIFKEWLEMTNMYLRRIQEDIYPHVQIPQLYIGNFMFNPDNYSVEYMHNPPDEYKEGLDDANIKLKTFLEEIKHMKNINMSIVKTKVAKLLLGITILGFSFTGVKFGIDKFLSISTIHNNLRDNSNQSAQNSNNVSQININNSPGAVINPALNVGNEEKNAEKEKTNAQILTNIDTELRIFTNTIKTNIEEVNQQYAQIYNKKCANSNSAGFKDLKIFIKTSERDIENDINRFIADITTKYIIPYSINQEINKNPNFINIKNESDEFVKSLKARFDNDLKRAQIEEQYVKPFNK